MATVRVWLLGSIEHGIYPTTQELHHMVNVVSQISSGVAEGEDMDLVWGPNLTVIELKGDGEPNIVCGPGIKVYRSGNTLRIEKDDS